MDLQYAVQVFNKIIKIGDLEILAWNGIVLHFCLYIRTGMEWSFSVSVKIKLQCQGFMPIKNPQRN